MPCFAYIVKCSDGMYYTGITWSLKKRIAEHNDGLSPYTKTYKPWKLIYFENFYCKVCADKREQFLKSGFGYRLRKVILENFIETR